MTRLEYGPLNLVAFAFAGFACISIVVFLASTQPFFINEVIGITKDEKIGAIIGTLGVVDEITSIITSPLLGALADKINASSTIKLSGSKLVQSASFLVIAFSLLGYSQFSTGIFPDLVFFRSVFAVGVTACLSMITVTLNELTNSDFFFQKFVFWKSRQIRETEEEYRAIPETSSVEKKNGTYAALVGISTGLGAIFAVSFFLTLPPRLLTIFPDLNIKSGLKFSYLIIAGYAVLVSIILFVFLYDFKKVERKVSIEIDPIAQLEAETEVEAESEPLDHDKELESRSYFTLIADALRQSKKDKQIQLAYVGAFVARSTTVTTSVFIPLLVYNYYYHTGKCGNGHEDPNYPSKNSCQDGYIFSAILTGVAQTVALISSPLWGWLIDLEKVGKRKTILIASIVGLSGNFGICLISNNSSDGIYDPHTVGCFVMVSLIGLAQIGTIISSMSLLSGVRQGPNMGSLSGLYSLCGGVGILLITKVGGVWSDYWILAPFFLLGSFNLVLLFVSASSIKEELRSRIQLDRLLER